MNRTVRTVVWAVMMAVLAVGAAGAQTKAAKGPLDGTWYGDEGRLKVSGGTYTIAQGSSTGFGNQKNYRDVRKGSFVVKGDSVTMTLKEVTGVDVMDCFGKDNGFSLKLWYTEAKAKPLIEKNGAETNSSWEPKYEGDIGCKSEFEPVKYTYKLEKDDGDVTLTLTKSYVDEEGKTKTYDISYEKGK